MTETFLELDKRHVWHPFTQAQTAPDPIVIDSAQGVFLRTKDGREIVDYISSWWVNLFGHAHPTVSQAIAEQAARLEQVIFAGFTHEPAVKLAKTLSDLLPGELNRVFFSDNGSTAVEVAMKVAYQHWRNIGQPNRKRFMTFDGAYHGDTVGAMSAGIASKMFDAWEGLLFSVDIMPYPETWENDAEVEAKETAALVAVDQHLAEHGSEICAMILEPLIQGAGGIRMVRPAFLKQLVNKIQAQGILVIFDEVMTGFGRTGENFACEKIGVVPDLICLSKGLTAGFLPLSVTVVTDRLYETFLGETFDKAFCHGHSFTANPLGCAAALASMELLQQKETRDSLKRIEQAHHRGLDYLRDLPQTRHHRVTGTVAAFDAVVDDGGYTSSLGGELKKWFWDRDMLIRPLGNVLYLLPPYCITDEQIDAGWKAMAEAMIKLNPR
ncbi:adenosylmethionine--8-amino-7-oxononanoate transaminase [Kiloniella laminariae]|uniref:adenosylmethionine--8-amino-7-oxononanoate transaminase n=1 Tax=Kiloniella laminariae TaxID=454162 RepID=UPI00036C612C|nr:adenosylmethionine--8-amino-7-oxononanoate transaminase [Kiloniella laminariae]